MASQQDKDIAVMILDELTTRLSNNIREGGFNNDSVMWIIKAWTKACIRIRGANYHRVSSAYYIMKRDPTPSNGKRSKALLSAIENFQNVLEKHGTTEGDFFNRADKAMLDFVWEYRKAVSGLSDRGKTEHAFAALLMRWKGLSAEQVEKEVVTNMDRSI
jgi:hypothetical protein